MPSTRDPAGGLVEADRPDRRARLGAGRGRRGPPGQRPQPRRELLVGERLDEVVVGARVEAGDPVADRVARGEHQDRQRREPLRAQPAGDLEPGDVGQADVEDDGVDAGARPRRSRGRSRRRARARRRGGPPRGAARSSRLRRGSSSTTSRCMVVSLLSGLRDDGDVGRGRVRCRRSRRRRRSPVVPPFPVPPLPNRPRKRPSTRTTDRAAGRSRRTRRGGGLLMIGRVAAGRDRHVGRRRRLDRERSRRRRT